MTRETFKLMYHLSKAQPWLDDNTDALEELLYETCDSDEKRTLIIELISRFKYISNDCFSALLNKLAHKIVTDPSLTEHNTQIVSISADSNADSGQAVLYGLKYNFEKLGWRNHGTANLFGKAYSTYKRNNKYKDIVLVDEFVGSGRTVISRVEEIERVFKSNGVDDFSIKVKVITSTEMGLQSIRNKGIDVESLITINKGISDHYPDEKVNDLINIMLELEDILSNTYQQKEMPSLGYGKAESLYTRQQTNTPNSVFPIFWWPFLKDGNERKTILIRAMGDA